MTDTELFTLIRTTLTTLLLAQGRDLPVVLGYAPTKQGREPQAIYYFPIAEPLRGWQGRKYLYDPEATNLTTEETQAYEMVLQVQGFALPDDEPSAGDLTKLCQMLVASNQFTQAMAAAGVGVQRPTNVRTIFFTNDYEQYEPNPNFDFTVSYNRSITQSTPAFDRLAFDLYRV